MAEVVATVNDGKKIGWSLADAIVIWVVCVSVVALTLFVLDAFQPKQAMLLGAACAVSLGALLRRRAGSLADESALGMPLLVALLLLAALFRVEPFPWINGGQDQGVYVNMSAHYQRGGGTFIDDPVPDVLEKSGLSDVYSRNLNRGGFQPGVYYGGEKDYVFQFYDLHPLWMAIFADTLGDDARVYALTFFSLLSIGFLTLLAWELSGSPGAAVATGLLLALNPLHAFFSKWPVTEVVALAFSSIGLYYLARAWRLAGQPVRARWSLALAGLALSLLFFVRISGFLYLPLLWAVFVVGVWLSSVQGNRFGRDLVIFAIACMGFYGLSVLYGLWSSPLYAVDIYRATFGRLAGGHWVAAMSVLALLLLLSMMAATGWLQHRGARLRDAAWVQPRWLVALLASITALAVLYSLYQVYRLGYTNAFASAPWLGVLWNLSGSGWGAVERSTALNALLYASPFLVVPGIFAVLRKETRWSLALLCILPAAALTAFVVPNPAIPYQYYYARYLLSEVVPYGIVIFTVAMTSSTALLWRRAGWAMVLASSVLFGFFTLRQFGAEEGVRPLKVLREIAAQVDDGDVLLIEANGWRIPRPFVVTPLRFYFGLNTFVISRDDRQKFDARIADAFRGAWLLSPRPIRDDRYVLRKRLLHVDRVMERSGHVPLKLVDDHLRQELYLYEMRQRGWPAADTSRPSFVVGDSYSVRTDGADLLSLLGAGWHELEAAHIWSSAHAELKLDASAFAGGRLPTSITLAIAPFAASPQRLMRVAVAACGEPPKVFTYESSASVQLSVPMNQAPNVEHCLIKLTVNGAQSPKALGKSNDARVLGVMLTSIAFDKSAP